MKKLIVIAILLSTSCTGPVFAGNWIDLQANTTYSEAQLEKRYDAQIRSKFPLRKERAMNRRAMGTIKGKYTPTAEEVADEAAYELHTKTVRDDLDQARTDNDLLKGVLAYEQAERRLQRYVLSEGRAAIAEVQEVVDEETGEVTQAFVPGVVGVDPLPATVTQNTYDPETGEATGTEDIPNPLIVKDEAGREAAQITIDGASVNVVDLVTLRL